MTDDNTGGEYPEDWQEQGWCCRDCGAVAWYSMSLELRRQLVGVNGNHTSDDSEGTRDRD